MAEEPRSLDEHQHLLEEPAGCELVDGRDDTAGVVGQVLLVAQRDLQAGEPKPLAARRPHRRRFEGPRPTGDDDAHLHRLSGLLGQGCELGQAPVVDDEPGDEPGVLGPAMLQMRGDGSIQRGCCRREDRRVIDEALEVPGHRHAPTIAVVAADARLAWDGEPMSG